MSSAPMLTTTASCSIECEGHVDHRPVSVQPDEPAAVHRPQESGAGGIIEGGPERFITSPRARFRANHSCRKIDAEPEGPERFITSPRARFSRDQRTVNGNDDRVC